uniref:Uncharacterized protein n=1 Tax=Arundo donax TaxID=35708 RepID=A0A0A9ACU7_ARUDO
MIWLCQDFHLSWMVLVNLYKLSTGLDQDIKLMYLDDVVPDEQQPQDGHTFLILFQKFGCVQCDRHPCNQFVNQGCTGSEIEHPSIY